MTVIKEFVWPPKITPKQIAMPRDGQTVFVPIAHEIAANTDEAVIRAQRMCAAHSLRVEAIKSVSSKRFGWHVLVKVRRSETAVEMPSLATLAPQYRDKARLSYERAQRLIELSIGHLEEAERYMQQAREIERKES